MRLIRSDFQGSDDTAVGPHEFSSLGWLDRFKFAGRCKACYVPRAFHPIHAYVMARPLGDLSPARFAWERVHTRVNRADIDKEMRR